MNFFGPKVLFAQTPWKSWMTNPLKTISTRNKSCFLKKPPEFGLLVDIDGVIVRGNKLIPGSKEAFHEFLTVGESFCRFDCLVSASGSPL